MFSDPHDGRGVRLPEGAVLVDEVTDPAHGGSLRLVTNPLRFDGERLPTRSAAAGARRAGTDEVLRW